MPNPTSQCVSATAKSNCAASITHKLASTLVEDDLLFSLCEETRRGFQDLLVSLFLTRKVSWHIKAQQFHYMEQIDCNFPADTGRPLGKRLPKKRYSHRHYQQNTEL